MKFLYPLVAAVAAGALVACGGGNSASTPSASPSASASVSTSPRASVTAVSNATSIVQLTNTPAPATATSEPPTATPEPPTEVPPTDTPAPPTQPPPPPTSTPPPAPTATPPPPPPAVNNAPTVVAKNLNFSPTTLTVKSGAAVTITLSNQDSFVPHNLNVAGVKTNDCTGPCSVAVSFTAPAPGNYGFMCTIHPTMTGTLVVVP